MDALEIEAKTVYAEYRRIRVEYRLLDRGNPLHKHRRVQLKEQYSELNERYADLMMGLQEARKNTQVAQRPSHRELPERTTHQTSLRSPAPRVNARPVHTTEHRESAPSASRPVSKQSANRRRSGQTQRRMPPPPPRKVSKRHSSAGEGVLTLRVVALGGWFLVVVGVALAVSFVTGYGREALIGAFETFNLQFVAEGKYGYIAGAAFMVSGAGLIGVSAVARRLLRLMAPVHDFARKGQVDALERVLAIGVDVNMRDRRGYTPLHFAVLCGHEAAAALLLESGADAETRNERGESPLFTAASNRDLPLLRLLIDNGANVHASNANGSTLMHVAASEGDLGLMELAGHHKLDREGTTKAGYTPLHFAAQSGNYQAVEHLLAAGVDPDPNCTSGSTPMCAAAHNGHAAIVRALIEAGAGINARAGFDYAGPLAIALEHKQRGVAQLLRQHGAAPVRSHPAA